MSRSISTRGWQPVAPAGVPIGSTYEEMLDQDPGWALSEGGRFFDEKGRVHEALRKIAGRLDGLNVPYAVAGGLALFGHGYRRFTEDIDILVTRDALKVIHKNLDGVGYLTPFKDSKNLRDSDLKVRIKFLISGQYPGDGAVKPITFPDPATARVEIDRIPYLNLNTLIELKLASGMTESARYKDLGDVQELIKILNLPMDLAAEIHPYVADLYIKLWKGAHRQYLEVWRGERLTDAVGTIGAMIAALRSEADRLESMQGDGVTLDTSRSNAEGRAYLVTTDPSTASEYDMHEESEFWDDAGADLDREHHDEGQPS